MQKLNNCFFYNRLGTISLTSLMKTISYAFFTWKTDRGTIEKTIRLFKNYQFIIYKIYSAPCVRWLLNIHLKQSNLYSCEGQKLYANWIQGCIFHESLEPKLNIRVQPFRIFVDLAFMSFWMLSSPRLTQMLRRVIASTSYLSTNKNDECSNLENVELCCLKNNRIFNRYFTFMYWNVSCSIMRKYLFMYSN